MAASSSLVPHLFLLLSLTRWSRQMLPPEVLTETPVSLIIMRLSVDFSF